MKRNQVRGICRAMQPAALFPAAVFPTAMLGLGLAMSAPSARAVVQLEEVIVTARRTEESAQEIPISMTVFNQETLDQRNVISAVDLVKYTPSLNANTRFGSDQASFAIRGFTQELRTTASVAVYFADVVAPRGGGSITAGDGAGPGAYFDLQNVQVLKGPQGTLFGRNTTGGAIQLVPQEPTNTLEGYLELSAGNYDMQRAQGVVNVPLSDAVRARFGIDTMQRDGYMKNVSGVGPDRLSDVDYMAGRASVIVDVTESVENYTILTYTKSENNGTIQGLFACDPAAPLAALCQSTLDSQSGDFYTVASGDAQDPASELEQWQLINTTTWNVSDDFTIKNIIAYADLEQTMRSSVFGTNFTLPEIFGPPFAGLHVAFFPAGQWPGVPTNSQTTFVEELQLSGLALDERLSWQAGLYYENSRPDGESGTLSAIFLACQQAPAGEPASWQCMDPFGSFGGSVSSQLGEIEYKNMAAYTQGTYDLSDQFKLTAGVRYTVDETEGTNSQISYGGFPAFSFGGPTSSGCVITTASGSDCRQDLSQKSEAPTWLIGLDYLPSADAMFYVKYARGYRQGSINMFGAEGVQIFEPEEVDAYEIGSKLRFDGPIPGTFNVAAFYNELSDQQIQVGYSSSIGAAATTTGIVNAGASTIQGVEIETTLELTDNLIFSLAYAYLDTRLDEITPPPIIAGSPYDTAIPSAVEGGELTFSPEHTATASLTYGLPLPADIGDVLIGASYTYVDEQLSTVGTFGMLDTRKLVSLNASWKDIVGSGFDLSLFATNITDEEYTVNVTGLYDTAGMDFRVTGEPKMYGARLKYNF